MSWTTTPIEDWSMLQELRRCTRERQSVAKMALPKPYPWARETARRRAIASMTSGDWTPEKCCRQDTKHVPEPSRITTLAPIAPADSKIAASAFTRTKQRWIPSRSLKDQLTPSNRGLFEELRLDQVHIGKDLSTCTSMIRFHTFIVCFITCFPNVPEAYCQRSSLQIIRSS
jgi:hypothetical protein